MADLLNSHTKIVFSKRLTTLEWNNSHVATTDPTEEIARLKQQSGKNISVSGGATLAQSLSRMGLIEEYNLVMHPIVLGSGKPLFKDVAQPLNLKLVSAKTFASGAIRPYLPSRLRGRRNSMRHVTSKDLTCTGAKHTRIE